MALRRTLSKRFLSAASRESPSPITAVPDYTPIPRPSTANTPGFFRRFLQRRAINSHHSPNSLPSFLTLPAGGMLIEKLNSLNAPRDHRPPEEGRRFRMSVTDAKAVLRFVQLERIRETVRNIPASTIEYGEFVQICGDVCGNKETGLEFAEALDKSGNVIVLGGVVFLRPDQVAKSMEKLLSRSITMFNDPRREELSHLEDQKVQIDKKAQDLVHRELYCGLGFFVAQTVVCIRLTFWELSWDVMEPICYFLASSYFGLGYGFFLWTSREPSFEGFFQSRFKFRQKKLMKIHNFDIDRYNHLCQAIYPKY